MTYYSIIQIIPNRDTVIYLQTIDSEELSTILENSGLYFTRSQIHDIITKIDADSNIALDFSEVLQV